MAKDYISIGGSPCDEQCVQVEPTGAYVGPMRDECKRFLELIRKVLGKEPDGAYLSVKGFPHDFGTYYEVVVKYDEDDETATKFAYGIENNSPTKWDNEAKKELGIKEEV